jgi:serine/threonine protein kinase/tetratricopeptide (TPR) repeat protein
MPLESGTCLGPYEIAAPLGSGAMGEVYRGRDTRLDREVAVKVLSAPAFQAAEARARFRREALALSRLNHPNIEIVYDFGSEGGTDYLVLELVPGETLATRLERGRIPEREAAELGAQMAEALEEAHLRGVMHRDLKPGNVIVTPKGRVKVLDFGLAKLAQPAGDVTQTMGLTEAGSTAGTLAYMAPEQLLGDSLDSRADLYALGVVLYEMLAGVRPFRAPIATALANEILHARVAPVRSLVPSLSARAEAVVMRAIERDPARRYQTAGEMLGELRRLATPGPEDSSEIRPGSPAALARRITSIVVLPLENLSGDAEQEFFADGMTEELIASLAQVRALRIISRTSAMRYKGQRKSMAEIARELNVDAVVEGSVRRAGERVKITAQLIDASTDHHLWARSYERDLKDVLALQGEVAQAICDEIKVSVTPQEESRLREARAVDPEAYEAMLKGRHLIETRTEDNLRRGLGFFEAALRRDPQLELAEVGLADAYNLMGYYTVIPPREAFSRAKAAAQRALAINPSSGEAMTSLAYPIMWHDWNRPEAERLFRKAIEINPRYSNTHLWLGNLYMISGRPDDSIQEFHITRRLDPLSMVAITSWGWLPYWYHRFDEAVVQLEGAIELVPESLVGRIWLGLSYAQLRRGSDAIRQFEYAIKIGGRVPLTLGGLAMGHAAAGDQARARELLAEMLALSSQRYVASYYPAQVLAALGEREAALEYLERALEERVHYLAAIRLDPSLDPLRGDPRFDSIVRRVAI